MGLVSAAVGAAGGVLADQWKDYYVAPTFDERTIVAPGVFQQRSRGRGANRSSSPHVISDGSKVVVPESTAVIVTDGGGIVSVSTEPGYFIFRNDSQPSLFNGGGVRASLVKQSWERFKFGGQPSGQQLIFYVNLREIRNLRFGTPGPLPYRDFSLVPPGSSQAPVLRLQARGQFSVRVVDPIRFFRTFVPAGVQYYSLADEHSSNHLRQEFTAAFQAALQALSRTTDIGSLASHGPELAAALTDGGGPEGSWIERFGVVVASAAVGAIEYDQGSRELMDKYNKGVLLGGGVGNAYTQTTIADSAMAMAESGEGGSGMLGLALGLGGIGGTAAGLTQPTTPAVDPAGQGDPVVALGQLKAMLDQGLITPEQYAAKQQEILGRL